MVWRSRRAGPKVRVTAFAKLLPVPSARTLFIKVLKMYTSTTGVVGRVGFCGTALGESEPVVLLFHNNAQPNNRADIKELEVVYPQRTARCQAQHQLAVVHVA